MEAARLALLAWQARQRRDPLSAFGFSYAGRENKPQRQMAEHVIAGHEVALDGANQSGKTMGGAALLVALAQGRPSLGGLKMPPARHKPVYWALTQTWKQQVEATQKAVLHWLGDWPHVVKPMAGVADAIQQIRVAPWSRPGAPKIDWARIWFHVHASGETLPGGRIDGAWGDEPVPMSLWEEVTARGKANQTLYRWITYTPIRRADWEPLKVYFEGCDCQLSRGRIRLHATIFDNPWLSKAHVAALLESWKGRWDYDARVYGAEVDETGQCPFDAASLSRWQKRVRLPELVEVQKVLSEVNGARAPLVLKFERFERLDPAESYYGVVDPSLGVASPEHDPGEFELYARMRPRLVARWGGYLEPYALGWLAGKIMAQYRAEDPLDIEMNDNLGIQVMRGARDAGHQHFASEVREDKVTGQVEKVYGWRTTATNRGGMIAAVQQALLEDSIEVPSQVMLDTLRGIVVNPKGRIEAGLRKHDEAMILLGRFAYISRGMGSPSSRIAEPTPARQRLAELLGVKPKFEPAPLDEWWRGE